jgi:hypothetical protein
VRRKSCGTPAFAMCGFSRAEWNDGSARVSRWCANRTRRRDRRLANKRLLEIRSASADRLPDSGRGDREAGRRGRRMVGWGPHLSEASRYDRLFTQSRPGFSSPSLSHRPQAGIAISGMDGAADILRSLELATHEFPLARRCYSRPLARNRKRRVVAIGKAPLYTGRASVAGSR